MRLSLRLASILVCACLAAPPFEAATSALTLTVLHTSDLHGHVDARDEIGDRDYGEGLARVAAVVRRVRAEGRPVLLLDSGDTIEGTPMQALALEAAAGQGEDPTIRAMNRIGYDAMAVGNHEFDFGLARLQRSRGQASFPWVSANILGENGRPVFAPYVIRSIAGLRVGILGLTTRAVPSWELPARIGSLRFEDTVATARQFVPLLREREKCDLVIVLTHQGFERDPATGQDNGSGEENQAYAIATEVPGIDLLLTGHTHRVIDPRRLGSAWISQPGRFGNTLTRFEVTMVRRGARLTVEKIEGSNLPMKDVVPDAEIAALVAQQHEAAMSELSRVVATLDSPVDGATARVSDSGLLDWLHEVQRQEGHADLSFASLLPGSLAPWSAGPLTVRQIWAFYPYENTVVTVKATGRQIREALEASARCVNGVAEQEGRIVWRRNPAVWGYNCDTAEGVEYALDPTRPEGHRLLFLKREDRPVGDGDVFTVALNSYRASGGGGFKVWRSCPRLGMSSRSLRELLIENAQSRKNLRLEANENWFLAPGLPEGKLHVN